MSEVKTTDVKSATLAAINNLIFEDKNVISYRPNFVKITGSVISAIFLQQVHYWWNKSGKEPFYKFKDCCEHPKYRAGDSWIEELGFRKKEFEVARNNVATKIVKGVSKTDSLKIYDVKHLILYWTNRENLTYYQLNQDVFDELMLNAYDYYPNPQ